MNPLSTKVIAISLITLVNMGVFAMPATVKADWTDILGGFGLGGSSQNNYSGYGNQGYYDYNSTDSNSDGDIKMSKEVREVGKSKYHDKIEVHSGALVEVWIEVKNTSSKHNANTLIRDEISGGMVYVKNSLRVNGQVSQPGLTSGGLRINIPSNGKAVITYQMYVCGNSDYPMRAYASAAGIGAATDAMVIKIKTFNVGYYDDTYSCVSQYQTGNSAGSTGGSNYFGNTAAGNPFGDWTGVNNSSNNSANNPFQGWTGVNNSNAANVSNPFGDWTGVQSSAATNPFGDWQGSSTSASNDPFGNWYGVQSSTSSNPFGDWTGTQNSGSYDMSGYSTNSGTRSDVRSNSANRAVAYTGDNQQRTNFVAPTTGVNPVAPFFFAGALTAGFVAYRKRKLLFN